jgi:hypothetical protein
MLFNYSLGGVTFNNGQDLLFVEENSTASVTFGVPEDCLKGIDNIAVYISTVGSNSKSQPIYCEVRDTKMVDGLRGCPHHYLSPTHNQHPPPHPDPRDQTPNTYVDSPKES